MTTIYIVTEGDYNEIEVDAVFSTRELAEKYMSSVRNPWYNDIEEMELDPEF